MKKWCSIFILLGSLVLQSCEKNNTVLQKDRDEVVMRRIGHEILLSSGNQISLVKPILKEGDQYRIQFGSEFGFPPEGIVLIIDSIISSSHIEESYLVKIEECTTGAVVYSYEVDFFSSVPVLDAVSCRERAQPKACYEIIIKFLEKKKMVGNSNILFLVIGAAFFILLVVFFRKKKSKQKVDNSKIQLGDYLYDPKKMVLIRQEKTIELTSKESDLLNVLYESVNETVEKETILNKVWGDEGDYVGRTLDVYVSKLRKKLESDESIELKNIRGVGYKLILED